MDSRVLVRSTGRSKEGHGVCRPKWCRTCLLSAFLLLCGVILSLNYMSTDFWSNIVKTWSQWGRIKGQESGKAEPHGTSSPTTLKSTTQAPWKPLGPFEILYPHEYQFILDEHEKCRSQSPFLVLMVPVAPHNRKARDTIRRTWGNESLVLGVTICRFFLLGLADQAVSLQEQLHAESKEHHDLLQANFLDSYLNLTIKTMVMMEWLLSHCPNASYAAKVDTDMFLNIDLLVSTLLDPNAAQPKQDYITGAVIRNGLVQRQKGTKWYVPEEVFPQKTYPCYVSGNAYAFSMDLPEKILKASRHVRAFHLEDVYLGMCLEHLGILPTDPPQPGLFYLWQIPYSRCKFAGIVSVTGFSLNEIDWYWSDFQKPGLHC